MAYDDPQDARDQIPPPPPRRSFDDETLAANQDRRSYPAPQPSSGGCSKGCLYGMAGCGCITVILAIVAGVVGYQFVKNAISNDPVVVTATAKEIADFDLPPKFEPVGKFDFWVAKVVVFVNKEDDSRLMLTELNGSFVTDKNAPDFENQNSPDERKLEITKSELREMKIRGEPAKVTFAEAKDLDTGIEYQVVRGRFQGKKGPAQFELQMPKAKYKEEDALKFVEGIK